MNDKMALAVAKAMAEGARLGKEPKLYVTGPNSIQVACGKVEETFAHDGAAQEMGDTLTALKTAGKWDDRITHGRWAFNLRHGAGVEIGRGARAPKVVSAPEPEPEPVKELNARELLAAMEGELVKLDVVMHALKGQIEAQRKLADAEQAAEDDAAEAQLAKEAEELQARLKAIAERKAARTPAPVAEVPVVEAPKGKGK